MICEPFKLTIPSVLSPEITTVSPLFNGGDVENVHRIAQADYIPSFWWFPDVKDSDDLIMNHPETESRINAGGERDKKLGKEYDMFIKKHGTAVQGIPNLTKQQVIEKIK